MSFESVDSIEQKMKQARGRPLIEKRENNANSYSFRCSEKSFKVPKVIVDSFFNGRKNWYKTIPDKH